MRQQCRSNVGAGPWPKSLMGHSTAARPDKLSLSWGPPPYHHTLTVGSARRGGGLQPSLSAAPCPSPRAVAGLPSPPEAAAVAGSAQTYTSAPQSAASTRLASPSAPTRIPHFSLRINPLPAFLPQRRPASRPSPSGPRLGPLSANAGL